MSVLEALERSLAAVGHLTERDAAAVEAARALARKIDAWDVIVEWALDDARESRGARPAVPQNDNVSLASFLKYLDALGLLPPSRPAGKAQSVEAPVNELEEMRKRLASA